MSGLDVEGVLSAHQISAFGPEDAACACDRTWRTHAAYRAHVAAVLREQIEGAEGVGRCGDEAPLLRGGPPTHCRLPHGHRGWHRGDDDSEWNDPQRPTAAHLSDTERAGDAE